VTVTVTVTGMSLDFWFFGSLDHALFSEVAETSRRSEWQQRRLQWSNPVSKVSQEYSTVTVTVTLTVTVTVTVTVDFF
jgi:hypothetical protein